MSKPCCCSSRRGTKDCSAPRTPPVRTASKSWWTARRTRCGCCPARANCRARSANGLTADGRAGERAAGNRARRLAPTLRDAAIRKSASRRKSSRGWKTAAAPPSASNCAANTNSRCKAANGPRRKRPCRSFPTSAKACCIWPSPNARCSPTKWVWAKPSRPSPPARCCTGSARRGACWSSRPLRSRPNGRIRFRNSPRWITGSFSAAKCSA